MVLGSNPATATSLRDFWQFHLPCFTNYCLSEETLKALLSGVYARGSKRSHQSALEMCNLSWTTPLLEKDNSKNNHVYIILKFECFTVSEGKESLPGVLSLRCNIKCACHCSLCAMLSECVNMTSRNHSCMTVVFVLVMVTLPGIPAIGFQVTMTSVHASLLY